MFARNASRGGFFSGLLEQRFSKAAVPPASKLQVGIARHKDARPSRSKPSQFVSQVRLAKSSQGPA